MSMIHSDVTIIPTNAVYDDMEYHFVYTDDFIDANAVDSEWEIDSQENHCLSELLLANGWWSTINRLVRWRTIKPGNAS